MWMVESESRMLNRCELRIRAVGYGPRIDRPVPVIKQGVSNIEHPVSSIKDLFV